MVNDECPTCHKVLEVGEWPYCPHGHGFNRVIGDDIPGGELVENAGHEPFTVYSKSEKARRLKELGVEPFVRHVPLPGSDKSPHTVDWSKGSMDPKTLANAEELVARAKTVKSEPSTVKPVPFTWTVRTLD